MFDQRLAGDGVRGVRVFVGGSVALYVLDDGDHDHAAGARQFGRPTALSGHGAQPDGKLDQIRGGRRAAELDRAAAGGRHGRLLYRHVVVRVPGRRVRKPEPREVHIVMLRGGHRRVRGADAGRVRPLQ